MSTYHHHFESEDHNAHFEVLIQYDYTPPERQRGARDYPDITIDGSIDLWEVIVLQLCRYDVNGDIVEEWFRGDSDDRARELDQLAFDKVQGELDEGWLAERLVREAS